jgi:hypothetical protein
LAQEVLKSKWVPKDKEDLANHDAEVVFEWEKIGKKLGGPLSLNVQKRLLSGEFGASPRIRIFVFLSVLACHA